MWLVWGPATDATELGVVADRCPHCRRLSPCRVTGITQGVHVYFVTVASTVTEAFCTCHSCGAQFPCELWQYSRILTPSEALMLPLDALLTRTNPSLRERLTWEARLQQHRADSQFAAAVQSMEQLRHGELRRGLMNDLLDWDQMDQRQRAEVVKEAEASARSLQLAKSVAKRLPRMAGCWLAALVCLAVWSAVLWVPALGNLLWGGATILAGTMLGAAIWRAILSRRMRRWTREVLAPESQRSGIDLQRFVAVLRDLPAPNPHSLDELRDLKDHEEIIRDEVRRLAAANPG